ncbi:hypothetical protein BT96DRAFT_1015921 [Gymnopus androsaceus JB14]|uniref:Protein kinase domain-containing protein n=1 Tax=Gymnopus androsaceus JB14 TaxID=1447944 RepID=A0A6A4HZY1_9AGAR|nr:hypothetical protein BT96DRAFT_1015921 [Gymnopus androsaceus JB14]
MSSVILKYALFTFKNFSKEGNTGVYKSTEPSKEDITDVANEIRNKKLKGQHKRLVFYKCENLGVLYCSPVDTLYERTLQWLQQHHETPLDEWIDAGFLNRLFPNGNSDTIPASVDLVAITEEDLQERQEQIKQLRSALRPSDGAATPEKARQTIKENRIRTGCPARNFALPSTLYSPILADLAHALSELNKVDPTTQALDLAHQVISDLIRSYAKETGRGDQLRDTLKATLLDENGGFFQHLIGSEGPKAKPQYFWPMAELYELKNTRGLGGDPILQAAFDYLKLLIDLQYIHFTQKSNCPCLALGVSGTQIEIACFVFAREVHFDSLFLENVRDAFDFHFPGSPIGSSPDDSTTPLPKFRFLQRFFSDPDDTENLVPGVFIGIMEETAGNGSYKEGDRVIVKFSTRYNSEAHELLAKRDLAPSLYYSQRLRGGDFILNIMEYVEGEMASNWEGNDEKLPREFFTKIELAITLLHESGYVFGDLQPQNILVVDSSEGRLVDFDWVARAGEGRYPASINPKSFAHGWAPGVERNGIMEKEHDIHMLRRIEALCRPN